MAPLSCTISPPTRAPGSLHPRKDLGRFLHEGAAFIPFILIDFLASPENVSAEWNVYTDPLAASKVFQSGVPIVLVPLDATNQVRINQSNTAA